MHRTPIPTLSTLAVGLALGLALSPFTSTPARAGTPEVAPVHRDAGPEDTAFFERRLRRLLPPASYLGLTEAQGVEVKALLDELRDELAPLRTALATQRQTLRDALAEDGTDATTLGNLVLERHTLRRAIRDTLARYEPRLMDLLDDEQRLRYDHARELRTQVRARRQLRRGQKHRGLMRHGSRHGQTNHGLMADDPGDRGDTEAAPVHALEAAEGSQQRPRWPDAPRRPTGAP